MKDAKVMTDHFEGIDKLVKEAPHTDGAPNFRRVSDDYYGLSVPLAMFRFVQMKKVPGE